MDRAQGPQPLTALWKTRCHPTTRHHQKRAQPAPTPAPHPAFLLATAEWRWGCRGHFWTLPCPLNPPVSVFGGFLSKDIKVIVLWCLSVEARLACGFLGRRGISAQGHGARLEGPQVRLWSPAQRWRAQRAGLLFTVLDGALPAAVKRVRALSAPVLPDPPTDAWDLMLQQWEAVMASGGVGKHVNEAGGPGGVGSEVLRAWVQSWGLVALRAPGSRAVPVSLPPCAYLLGAGHHVTWALGVVLGSHIHPPGGVETPQGLQRERRRSAGWLRGEMQGDTQPSRGAPKRPGQPPPDG